MSQTIQQKKQEREQVLQEMQKLNDLADSEARDLTPDETKEYGLLENRFDTLTASINRQEKAVALNAVVASSPEPSKTGSNITPSNGVMPAGNGTTVGATVRVKKEEYADDPKGGFRDIVDFCKSLQDFGQCFGQGRLQQFNDPRMKRLTPIFNADCDDTCFTTTDDSSGGAWIPEGIAGEIISRDPLLPTAAMSTAKRTMDTVVVPFRYRVDSDHRTSFTGGLTVGRHAEACCEIASRNKYGKYNLTAYTQFAMACASQEQLERAPTAFIEDIADSFNIEFEAALVRERLFGTGQGEYFGVLDDSNKSLVQVTRETAGTVTLDDIYGMEERHWGSMANKVWMATLGVQKVLKTLQDANLSCCSNFAYQAIGGPAWAHGTLDGIPIVFTEFLPDMGKVGDIGLYDWSQYIEGVYRGLQSASSIHAKFECHQSLFKFWRTNAGRPAWNDTLIPACGNESAAFTLSPFVVLTGDPADCCQP